MADKKTIQNKIIIYKDSKGNVELKADIEKDTIWATQAQIAELFDVNSQAITKHIQNIYIDGELEQKSTSSKMEQVQKEGNRDVRRSIEYYNLDIIIAVGYRINSKKATQFRIWATKTLREYIINGIAINTERIKQLPDKILKDLDEKILFIQKTIKKRELSQSETDSLLSVIHDYANSWKFLKEYDEGDLKLKKNSGLSMSLFEML